MNDSLSFPDARAALAKGLKKALADHETKIATLRARELKKSTGNKALSKNDLCLLCSNAVKACTCLTKSLKKDDGMAPSPGLSLSEMCGTHGADLAKCGPQCGMKKGEGCKECGGVGSHKTSCATGLKNPKTVIKDAVKKDELPIVKPAPEAPAKGAALPEDKKPKKQDSDAAEGGNDAGKIKKAEKTLRKDLTSAKMPVPGAAPLPGMAKPAGAVKGVVGVPGKQPVGQGGGDAFKVPQAAAPTPVAQVNKELGSMKSVASRPMPGMGAPLVNAPKAAAPVVGNNLKPVAGSFIARKDEVPAAGAAQPIRDAANLEADKKAGGVGWLNALHSRLTAPKPQRVAQDVMAVRDQMNLEKPVAPAGSVRSLSPVLRASPRAGITGQAALARGEKAPSK